MSTRPGNHTFIDAFAAALDEADQLDIATGYASKGAVMESDRQLQTRDNLKVRISLGMYCFEGMPEGIYHVAMEFAGRWQESGRGDSSR